MATFPIGITAAEAGRARLRARLGKKTDKSTVRAAIQLLEYLLGRNHFRQMPEVGTHAPVVLELAGDIIADETTAPKRCIKRYDELEALLQGAEASA